MATEEQVPINPIDRESNVLVVGSSRGLGLEFVRQVLQKKAHVIATYRGKDAPLALTELAAGPAKGRLQLIECDVASAESVAAAAQMMRGQVITTHRAAIFPPIPSHKTHTTEP